MEKISLQFCHVGVCSKFSPQNSFLQGHLPHVHVTEKTLQIRNACTWTVSMTAPLDHLLHLRSINDARQ